MIRPAKPAAESAEGAAIGTGPIAVLIAVIEELVEILTLETELLRAGMPPYIARVTERKEVLQDQFATLWPAVASNRPLLLAQPEAVQDRLIAAARRLSHHGHENVALLQQALSARQARVATVMRRLFGHEASAAILTGHFHAADPNRPVS